LLWNFDTHSYHDWVFKEGIKTKLAPIYNCDEVISISQSTKRIPIGVGLHDSSAALIPYLTSFNEPFILLSTGTWCISLNPFNSSPLTEEELKQDCLCYLSYQGKPVKASRLFAGYEHDQQTKRLASHYFKPADHFTSVEFNSEIIAKLKAEKQEGNYKNPSLIKTSLFNERDLVNYPTYEEAYHQLIFDIMQQQVMSTQLVLRGTEVKRIFVDGGFSKNQIYMQLLASAFPGIEVFAALVSHATALGAALILHKHWNLKPLPKLLIKLKYFHPDMTA
jgi:sugar (pentulose or hexulose) kinase